MEEITLAPGEVLYRENKYDSENSIYLVTKGSVEIYYETRRKKSIVKTVGV